MGLFKWAKKVIKKMTVWDVGFLKLAMIAFGILLVYWIPAILNLNMWWWVAIFVLLVIKPITLWFR